MAEGRTVDGLSIEGAAKEGGYSLRTKAGELFKGIEFEQALLSLPKQRFHAGWRKESAAGLSVAIISLELSKRSDSAPEIRADPGFDAAFQFARWQ